MGSESLGNSLCVLHAGRQTASNNQDTSIKRINCLAPAKTQATTTERQQATRTKRHQTNRMPPKKNPTNKRREGWVDWLKCPARARILNDLEREILTWDANLVSAEQAWETYKGEKEFVGVQFSQFKQRLKDHRKKFDPNRETPAQKNKGWVKWRKTKAREIMMDDMAKGDLPVAESKMSAEQAWEIYKGDPAFEGIPFDQFKARLADYRKRYGPKFLASREEELLMRADRVRFPRRETDGRGYFNFDVDEEAKACLREDVLNNKHKQMEPRFLRQTRKCYFKYKLRKFRPRIYQMVRRLKFEYYLQEKRSNKGLKPDDSHLPFQIPKSWLKENADLPPLKKCKKSAYESSSSSNSSSNSSSSDEESGSESSRSSEEEEASDKAEDISVVGGGLEEDQENMTIGGGTNNNGDSGEEISIDGGANSSSGTDISL